MVRHVAEAGEEALHTPLRDLLSRETLERLRNATSGLPERRAVRCSACGVEMEPGPFADEPVFCAECLAETEPAGLVEPYVEELGAGD